MKKYLIIFLAVISTSFFVGCDSDDEFTPPNYVTFAENELDFTVEQNSSGSFEVTVFTANQVGSDRTFTVNVDESSTLNSSDYVIPQTVTVPGGTNEGTFTIEVTDNAIDDAGETLVLTLGNPEGFVGDELTVNVLKLCEFTSLAPSYTASVTAFGEAAPSFDVVLTEEGDMEFKAETLWGKNFIAWAAGSADYAGLFPYSGTITLNADNSLTITSEEDAMDGGTGNYNPCTGTFSYSIVTSLFSSGDVTVDVVLTPNEETDGGDTDGGDGDGDGTDE